MEEKNGVFKAEVDTSAPFDSVKDAVNLFGSLGFWKPTSQSLINSHTLLQFDVEDVDVSKVEEQAAELEKELILKERDTLDVLKELEATKMIVEELKSKLHSEESATKLDDNDGKHHVAKEEAEEEKENNPNLSVQTLPQNANSVHSSNPSMILMELKQAKLNLTKTTGDLVAIRASVETYNKKIERERISLEKTRERLRTNSSKISSLENEINVTRSKLEEVKDGSAGNECSDGIDIMAKLQQLSAEADEFKKMGEVAKSEVMRVMLEIEQTKSKVKTAEIRLVAAQKMKDAARAAEAVALAEIKALEKSESAVSEDPEQHSEQVALTLEEYSSLKSKARGAEESSDEKILEALVQVDEVNASKDDILMRVEEAMEEVKASKQVLEDALNRVEQANQAKLLVEEALRKWRSENGEKRRSIPNSTKFKNPCPSHHRRDAKMLDVNGITLVNDENAPVLKPTLSIGQILSNKLLIAEEFESGKGAVKRKVSLGQMLGKPSVDLSSAWKLDHDSSSGVAKKLPAKRKKFSFPRISVLLTTKQSKKKKKSILTGTR